MIPREKYREFFNKMLLDNEHVGCISVVTPGDGDPLDSSPAVIIYMGDEVYKEGPAALIFVLNNICAQIALHGFEGSGYCDESE